MELKKIIEALLFASDHTLNARQLQKLFPELEMPSIREIDAACESLMEDYYNHAVELRELATGYRFQVRAEFAPWITRLFEEKPPKYSRALLETLAIIVYHQPVTRGDIEDIRGVGVSSQIIHTLLEREWIEVTGQKEVPGRPALYGTTKQFLDYFNVSSLEQLPALEKLKEWDEVMIKSQPTLKDNSEQQTENSDSAKTDEPAT
ncbi:MAG: SMC-Scp complex subunit ScpB [Methylococcaceae bacterium]|nr:SMC-Scp complex subunit ScpB [Methylococcaceae bacterium]